MYLQPLYSRHFVFFYDVTNDAWPYLDGAMSTLVVTTLERGAFWAWWQEQASTVVRMLATCDAKL